MHAAMSCRFPKLSLLFLFLCLIQPARADVVKPALIEISAYTSGRVEIEVRASIEALLTGINAQYKDTTQAPTAEDYDVLRNLPPEQLLREFEPFRQQLLRQVFLQADGVPVTLDFTEVTIPERGYPKVPRISVIRLQGELDPDTKSLVWYYPAAFGDNAVRVRQVDEANERWHWSEYQWLRDDQPSQPFSLAELFAKRPIMQTIFEYMVIGFEHIVPKGTDHILFILGIFLLSLHLRPLLWQVTMFTLAHTLTLGLSMNGIISLPPAVVEPLIALSIAYVGIENIFAHSLHRSRLYLVFCFGLLHGLGFAGVLADFGMPADAFATALISFNVGVEFGQLAVILAAFLLVGLWCRHRDWYHDRVVAPGSAVIAIIGLYWTIERLNLF